MELEEGNALDKMINMRSEVHCRKCKGHLVSGRRRGRAEDGVGWS